MATTAAQVAARRERKGERAASRPIVHTFSARSFASHHALSVRDVAAVGAPGSAASSSTSTLFYVCPDCGSRYCTLPTDCSVCGLPLLAAPHLARSYHHLFPVVRFVDATAPDVCAAPDSKAEKSARSPTTAAASKAEPNAVSQSPVERSHLSPAVRDMALRATHCEACLRMLLPAVGTAVDKRLLAALRMSGDSSSEIRMVCPKCHSVYCSDCDTFIHGLRLPRPQPPPI